MSRVNHDVQSQGTPNPAKKFLEWKSNNKNFGYYDSGAGENIEVDLPFKFVFLQHYHTVRGWDNVSDSRLFSNEVLFIGTQPLKVKSFKGGEIAEGLYKDIKVSVISRGGQYHRSVYIMLEDGTVANLMFKGAATAAWTDFVDANKSAIDANWIEVTGAEDHKKGSIKYTTPVFQVGKKVSKAQDDMANSAAGLVEVFFNEKFNVENKPAVEDQKEETDVDPDDLGF